MSAIIDGSREPAPASGGQKRGSVLRFPGKILEGWAGTDEVSYEITQPILFKGHSLLAACILSIRAAAPAALSSLMLYGFSRMYGVPTSEFLSKLTILVTVLSILLLQPSRNTAGELLAPRWKMPLDLLLRWSALLIALAIIAYATGYSPHYPEAVIGVWAITTPIVLVLATLALQQLARSVLCRPQNARNIVFVGFNQTSMHLAKRLKRHPELCMNVQGFFDDRSIERLHAPKDLDLKGSLSELPAFVLQHKIEAIFICLPMRHIRRVKDLLDDLGDTTVSLYYVPDVLLPGNYAAQTREMFGVPIIAMRESPFYGTRLAIKRLMDVTIAATALLLLSPVLLSIALAIKLTSPGPVFFRQRRYGLDGREIVIYKFRTMSVTEDAGWMDQARRDDPRVTTLGRYLRRWSLDEFPQLINVLQGRMSLVGPRPHAVAHNEEYRRLIRGYMARHKVPPGITGLAQVKGFRGETRRLDDMRGRVHYDLKYMSDWSLLLDLKILLMTIPRLLRTEKAY
ncbi:MAG: undecaprenyl-phosphate glucose phosphotransferase [Povalibacter sp.]